MSIKVNDRDIEYFEFLLEEPGAPTASATVSAEIIQQWVGKLPNRLLYVWQELGWCNFNNGLLWLVNPDDYAPIVETWLSGTKYAEMDTFHCFARDAFGEMYLYAENIKRFITIKPQRHTLWVDDKELLRPDSEKGSDISVILELTSDDEIYDCMDIHGKGLFDRAVKKLGALKADEMYAFEPFLCMLPDEKITIDYLTKVRMDVHLDILHQLKPVTSRGTSYSDIFK